MEAIRLLYLPNEQLPAVEQVGPRRAFEAMAARGELSAYEVYSFLHEYRAGQPAGAVCEEILGRVHALQPDVLLWQHVSEFPLDAAYLRRVKEACPGMVLVYHEGDACGPRANRVSPAMRALASECDVLATTGLGRLARNYRVLGARRVLYTPSCAETQRFGTPWVPTKHRRLDAVLIGNRLPGLTRRLRLPANVERERLVRRLERLLGSRFEVYGANWTGACARGRIPYELQETMQRQAWLGINWDNVRGVPYYFSDRLPVSLLSGVAQLTSYQPGYEHLFRDGEHLVFARSVDEVVDRVDFLLSQPASVLIELGLAGQALARERLVADVVYPELVRKAFGLSATQSRGTCIEAAPRASLASV